MIHRLRSAVLPAVLLCSAGPAPAAPSEPAAPTPPAWPALRATVPADQLPGFDFLVRHLPGRDRETLDPVIVLETLDLAYRARAEFPWAKSVPEDLFLNDVLPYAFVNETRENWRPGLYAKVAPLVRDAPTRGEAIRRINLGIARLTGVKYSTDRRQPHQAPGESMAFGKATCTGLSILLAGAFRSVGIPARLCGTARWGDLSGNHMWVEVWDDGWHFTEYYPDEGGLDRGWIIEKCGLADPLEPFQRIVATTWKPGDEIFRMAWDPTDLSRPAVHRTSFYQGLAGGRHVPVPDGEGCLAIRAFARPGGPRVSVPVVVTQAGVELRRAATGDEQSDRSHFVVVCADPGLPLVIAYDGRAQTNTVTAGQTTDVDLIVTP